VWYKLQDKNVCMPIGATFFSHLLTCAFFFCTGSPTTRWASVALGAGVGIGAAYTECSYLFNGAPPKWSPKVSTVASAHSEVIALSFLLDILVWSLYSSECFY
jgi:hypothetical protein